MSNGRPNPGLIPGVDDALRRLTDRELRSLVYGCQVLADGRVALGHGRTADVFLALRNHAAEEEDRRRREEADIGEELNDLVEGIWDPDQGVVD